ncbi:MAG: carboxy-S-adenosyl-L-methionine synthase CmoA [Myxococcota bacterium]
MLSIPDFVRQSTTTGQDGLFNSPKATRDFVFDKAVVEVFPDMIGRSVPGYWEGAEWIGMLSKRFATTESRIYDLGCSLGAVPWGIYRHWHHECPHVIAVDNSKPMITGFQTNLNALQTHKPPFELHCADVRHFPISNADIVVMHFTLQFIPKIDRQALLQRIYDGLNPGGVLILSEKLRGENNGIEQRLRAWHHDFKRKQGYSDLEIKQKSDSIANVMPLDTPQEQHARLRLAGFETITPWLQCFNFSSLVAEKSK